MLGSPYSISGSILLRFSGSFHLSFTVLLLYRFTIIYLGLPELHLALRVPLSRNTTLKASENSLPPWVNRLQGYYLLWHPIPWNLAIILRPTKEYSKDSLNDISPFEDFTFALYPLRSPLLGVSFLFSFPSVNEMLQFTE